MKSFLNFRVLIILLPPLFFSTGVAKSPAKVDKSWTTCKKSEDCATIKGCCDWVFANKRFTSQVKAQQNEICPVVECAGPPHFEIEPKVECINSTCRAKPQK